MRKLIFLALLALPLVAHAGDSDAGSALFGGKCVKCHQADYRSSREAAVREAHLSAGGRGVAAHGKNRSDLVATSLKVPSAELINWMTSPSHAAAGGACAAVGMRPSAAADVMAFLVGRQTAAPNHDARPEGVKR